MPRALLVSLIRLHTQLPNGFNGWICSKPLFNLLLLNSTPFPFSTQNEKFTLQFRFDQQYPISSPAVQFVVTEGRQAPVHPVRHIYTCILLSNPT